jgi:hypothetical protein
MAKRILSAALWFYTGWYAGAMIAFHLGISEAIGPLLGAAAAALFAGDPRGLIWKREPAAQVPSGTAAASPAR